GLLQARRCVMCTRRNLGLALAATALLALPARGQDYLYSDSHFHLTNYVQEGTDAADYVAMMGNVVERSTLFGIPLQQAWEHENTVDSAPTYSLQTNSPLYYYSFTDATIAMAYRSLPPEQQARLD